MVAMRETLREAGAMIGGRYRLVRQLGAGGMGAVWQAEDVQLGRSVAVKLVTAQARDDAHVLQRFVQEATLIAKLKSPNVVEIHDFGFDEQRPFIVMELLEGDTLSKRLGRGGRVPLETAKLWCTQLCKALSAAHAMGVVHRDLKPSNVILVSDGDDEILKVFDFGIAMGLHQARITRNLLGEGAMLGTPGYMSPEQVRGEDVDARSDLWAVGVLLYRALTGKLPFSRDDTAALLMAIVRDEPRPPTQVQPSLPSELDMFMARALAKAPAGRFASARELAAAFRSIEAPSLPTAAPGPAAEESVATQATRTDVASEGEIGAGETSTTAAVTKLWRAGASRVNREPPAATRPSGRRVAGFRRPLPSGLAALGGGALLAGAVLAYVLLGPSGSGSASGGGPDSGVLADTTSTGPHAAASASASVPAATSSAAGPEPSGTANASASRSAGPAAGTGPGRRPKSATTATAAPRSTPASDLFAHPW